MLFFVFLLCLCGEAAAGPLAVPMVSMFSLYIHRRYSRSALPPEIYRCLVVLSLCHVAITLPEVLHLKESRSIVASISSQPPSVVGASPNGGTAKGGVGGPRAFQIRGGREGIRAKRG
ncbi:hypothetical protein F4802DRAFT_546595 [Xylaria palmicola]|nr:hypothetical protein F4802DRAFT_546595 [Xylaria palmicola]